jgi:glutamine synthetase
MPSPALSIFMGCVKPKHHFGQMMQGSELFTGAALDGVPQDVNDEEVAAMPDPATATVLPWKPEVVWFASGLYLKGRPFDACCRGIDISSFSSYSIGQVSSNRSDVVTQPIALFSANITSISA